jgi:hypothetical protein
MRMFKIDLGAYFDPLFLGDAKIRGDFYGIKAI